MLALDPRRIAIVIELSPLEERATAIVSLYMPSSRGFGHLFLLWHIHMYRPRFSFSIEKPSISIAAFGLAGLEIIFHHSKLKLHLRQGK